MKGSIDIDRIGRIGRTGRTPSTRRNPRGGLGKGRRAGARLFSPQAAASSRLIGQTRNYALDKTPPRDFQQVEGNRLMYRKPAN